MRNNDFISSLPKSLLEASRTLLEAAPVPSNVSQFAATSKVVNKPQTVSEMFGITDEDLAPYAEKTHVAINAPAVSSIHKKVAIAESYDRKQGIVTVLVENTRYRLKKGQFEFVPASADQLSQFVASAIKQ